MRSYPGALHGRRLSCWALERVFRKLGRLLPLGLVIGVAWCAFYFIWEGRPLRGVTALVMVAVIVAAAWLGGK